VKAGAAQSGAAAEDPAAAENAATRKADKMAAHDCKHEEEIKTFNVFLVTTAGDIGSLKARVSILLGLATAILLLLVAQIIQTTRDEKKQHSEVRTFFDRISMTK